MRHDKGWSQADVAQRLAVSVAAYSKIEMDVTDLNTSRLEQLGEIFEVSLADLIFNGDNPIQNNADEVTALKATINDQLTKIVHLQEYIISLYEQINEVKKI